MHPVTQGRFNGAFWSFFSVSFFFFFFFRGFFLCKKKEKLFQNDLNECTFRWFMLK